MAAECFATSHLSVQGLGFTFSQMGIKSHPTCHFMVLSQMRESEGHISTE